MGVTGGVYGVGGGSFLAPVLLALGCSAYEVAPATLTATFLTSLVGIAAFEAIEAIHGGAVVPDWALGAFLGAGGFAGSYVGARVQRRMPEQELRRLLGLIACGVAVSYIVASVQPDDRPRVHVTAR